MGSCLSSRSFGDISVIKQDEERPMPMEIRTAHPDPAAPMRIRGAKLGGEPVIPTQESASQSPSRAPAIPEPRHTPGFRPESSIALPPLPVSGYKRGATSEAASSNSDIGDVAMGRSFLNRSLPPGASESAPDLIGTTGATLWFGARHTTSLRDLSSLSAQRDESNDDDSVMAVQPTVYPNKGPDPSVPQERETGASGQEPDSPILGPSLARDIAFVSPHPSGYGGMSDIYEARMTSVADASFEMVALKVLRVATHGGDIDKKIKHRLRNEISVWSRLQHPNILPLYGIYSGSGLPGRRSIPAMVSPWCSNGNINMFLKAREASAEKEDLKLKLAVDILCGLHYLHNHEPTIVHADIKGANVLVADNGDARLCDFGFATVLAENWEIFTHISSLKGTFRWMSPELIRGTARHTRESDIWACGCLILEIQSGKPPYFDKANETAAIIAISNQELPSPPTKTVPDDLWTLIKRCCNPDARLRPTVGVLLQEMQEILRLRRGGMAPQLE